MTPHPSKREQSDPEVFPQSFPQPLKKQKGQSEDWPKYLILLVGAAGFELATPCTPCKCATRLRYAPTSRALYCISAEFKPPTSR